jgi:hypothetical protein
MSVKHFKHRLMILFCLIVSLCSLLTTRVESALASSQSEQGLDYSRISNSPGSLTVEGKWKYSDRDSQYEYADRFLVQLLNQANPDPSNPLDETQSDSNGYFKLSTI